MVLLLKGVAEVVQAFASLNGSKGECRVIHDISSVTFGHVSLKESICPRCCCFVYFVWGVGPCWGAIFQCRSVPVECCF